MKNKLAFINDKENFKTKLIEEKSGIIDRISNNINIKKWNSIENYLYVTFIENFMINLNKKKNVKIFVMMSNFIKTRTPSQCRSHHQKFYKKTVLNFEIKKYYIQKFLFQHISKSKILKKIILYVFLR